MKDMYNEETWEQLIAPAVRTADANGTAVNLAGYGSASFCASIGVVPSGDQTLDASNKFEFELEESDDNSTFSDVADADVIDYVAGTNDGCFGVVDDSTEAYAVFTCHYIGDKQYVRPVLNVTGTMNTGTPIGVTGVKRDYKYPPT